MNITRVLLAMIFGLFLLLTLCAQQPGAAVIGWYNGEWQSGIPSLANWYMASNSFSCVYDEFEVPAGGWTVIGVFSDNGLDKFPEVIRASWEIRRDMKPRHGGKLIARGKTRATQIPDPSVTPSHYLADEVAKHFRIQVDGLNVHLPAGRYWLSVAPVREGESFLSATRGSNAVGTDNGRLGIALFRRAGGPAFVAADSVGSSGQLGIGQHFAQGVIIAK